MKKIPFLLILSLVATSALADKSQASTFYGTVVKIENNNEFILRDDSRIMRVKIASNKPPILNEGDSVTVKGLKDSTTHIHANNIILLSQAGL